MTLSTQVHGFWTLISSNSIENDLLPYRGFENETALFHNAVKTLHEDLSFQSDLSNEYPKPLQDVLAFYRQILEDSYFIEGVDEIIRNSCVTAVSALDWYFETTLKAYRSASSYLQARSMDFNDLKQRLTALMLQPKALHKTEKQRFNQSVILGFMSPSVSDLLNLDLTHVKAVISPEGSHHSHFAIILATYHIPYEIIPFSKDTYENGAHLTLNLINHTLTPYDPSIHIQDWHPKKLSPSLLASIHLHPSLNFIHELPIIVANDWQSIGLVRTEFLFITYPTLPDWVTQFHHYMTIADKLAPLRVRFRLFDHEKDKTFMGYPSLHTGMDFLLNHPDVLMSQLQALLWIATQRPIGITLPMVRTIEEVVHFQGLLMEQMAFIQSQSNSTLDVQIGIMIEQKSLISSLSHLEKIDYILIGTNDLSADNAQIERIRDMDLEAYTHPSLLDDLRQIQTIAQTKGWQIIICGDAANHESIIKQYQSMNFNDFSPSISVINNGDDGFSYF